MIFNKNQSKALGAKRLLRLFQTLPVIQKFLSDSNSVAGT